MRRSFVRWPTFQFCRVLFTEVNFLAPVRLIVQRIQRPGPAQKTRTYRGRSTNHLLKCLKGVLGTLRIIIFQLAVQSGFSCATKPWKLAGGGHQHYLLKTSSSRRRQAWRNFRSIIKILLRDTVHNLHSISMYVCAVVQKRWLSKTKIPTNFELHCQKWLPHNQTAIQQLSLHFP